jgi:O-antigen/teichoic acid export membrane protein
MEERASQTLNPAPTQSVAHASSIYIGSSAASAAVGFLTLPILTRVLSPDDFGVLGLLAATFGILTAVVGLSPNLIVTARFAVLSRETLRDLITASVPLTVVTGTLAWLAMLAVTRVWTDWSVPGWVLYSLTAMAMLGVYRTLGLTLIQMQHRPKAYAAIEVGAALLAGLLALVLVIGFDFDWRGKFLADAAAAILFGSGLLVRLARRGYLTWSVSSERLKDLAISSMPLSVHTLGYWALNAQDRYFVGVMVGVGAVGVYTVGYTLGQALNLVHTGVLRGFSPHFYERARLGDSERLEIVRFTYAYILASLLLWVVFVIGAWWVAPLYLGPRFAGVVAIVPWVALAYTFNAIRNCMVGYLYLAERRALIGALTGVAALLNAVLNVVFIRWWGVLGAAVATAVTFAVVAALTTIFAVRVHPMPWRLGLRRRR